jgi:hypothetical protein
MMNAHVTASKVRAEVEQRRQEFEKLQNVDTKITDEISSDVDSIREEGETRKRALAAEKNRLKVELSMLKKAAKWSQQDIMKLDLPCRRTRCRLSSMSWRRRFEEGQQKAFKSLKLLRITTEEQITSSSSDRQWSFPSQ